MTPKDKAVADLITAAKYAADEIDSLVSFAVRQCEFEGDEDASLGTANSLRIAAHCCKLFGSEAEALTAWNTRAVNSHHDLIEALTDVGASLAAAISLLERGGKAAKKAAPSDRMFDQMVKDYKASLERTRAALKEAGR